MKPGPKPTTRRGRAAGAVEIRAWVSAEEYARIAAMAKAAGVNIPTFVRQRALTPEPS